MRRLLVAGLGLFTIASLTAGLADSLGVLVVSRALQGLGAAMAAPAALSILTSTFEEGPSRNKALGIFGGFLSIVYGISESATSGWTSAGTIGFLAGGVVLLVAFLAIESRAAFPLMPLSMLRRGTLNAANVVAALMFGSFLGFVLQANLLIQHGFGYSAIATGLAWMATSLTALTAASVVAPRLLTRIGPGRTLVIGQATAVAGLMSLARTPAEAEYWRDLFPGLLAMGIAIGLSAVAVQVAAFIGIDGGVRGLAGGMLETAREVGGALGTAVLAAVAVAASGDVIGGASADSAGATALTAGLVLRRAERAAETGQPVPEPELEVGS
jgi:predicted MFS family arabinose efflux permease